METYIIQEATISWHWFHGALDLVDGRGEAKFDKDYCTSYCRASASKPKEKSDSDACCAIDEGRRRSEYTRAWREEG